MDILFKLRILVWLLVLGLWAHLTYQFVMEEGPAPEPQMRSLSNPFPQQPLPAPSLIPPAVSEAQPESSLATAAPPGSFIAPLPPAPPPAPARREPPRARPNDESLRRHEFGPLEEEARAPAGFFKTATRHFAVFAEGENPNPHFLDTLENLHANLMLDLAAFSPWANEEKVAIFLFRSQEAYRRITGRPAWSGGASSVSKRTIYLYESDEMIGILAHEMCHIYFDGYFLGGKPDPLWLSEGLATLIQVERGLSTPNWLPENLEILGRGGGFHFSDLMRVVNTAGANDDNVRLWYAESYSVVRFMLRLQGRSSFFHFCQYLREGRRLHEALFRAYGMPFNRVRALEYAWRYNLKTRRLIPLRASP